MFQVTMHDVKDSFLTYKSQIFNFPFGLYMNDKTNNTKQLNKKCNWSKNIFRPTELYNESIGYTRQCLAHYILTKLKIEF